MDDCNENAENLIRANSMSNDLTIKEKVIRFRKPMKENFKINAEPKTILLPLISENNLENEKVDEAV